MQSATTMAIKQNHSEEPVRKATGHSALLLIDFLNDFAFRGGENLVRPAMAAAKAAGTLALRARKSRVPVIYVNDNFQRWSHDFGDIVQYCKSRGGASAAIAGLLSPKPGDFVILKPKNSGFYETPLATLLEQVGARHLYLSGLTADNCILFTANDAHLRDYALTVVRDAVASRTAAATSRALQHMIDNTKARVVQAASVRF